MKIKELQVLKFYYKSFDWLIKSEKENLHKYVVNNNAKEEINQHKWCQNVVNREDASEEK